MINRFFEKKFYKYLFSFFISINFDKFKCGSEKINSFINDFKKNILKIFPGEIKEEFIFDLFVKNPLKSTDYENIGKIFYFFFLI